MFTNGKLSRPTPKPSLAFDWRAALAEESDERDQRQRRAAKLDDVLQRVLSLPGRVSAVKGLSEALRNLIGLEREA